MEESVCFPSLPEGNNQHHNHGRCPRKWPPTAAYEVQFWRTCVGLIGDNAPSKQICFSPAMSWSKALKTLRWCSNDGDESCLAIGAFWGLETGSLPEESIFACSGHCPPSIKRIVAIFLAFKVVLGGHFWRRRPWRCGCCWPLAVGSWSLGAFAGTNPT